MSGEFARNRNNFVSKYIKTMETIIQSTRRTHAKDFAQTELASFNPSHSLSQRYNALIKRLEFSHFAVIAMAILIGSCLGSISAMFVFHAHAPIWVFAIGLFATMTNLVTCIAQAPTKWVVNMFLLSVVVNVTL